MLSECAPDILKSGLEMAGVVVLEDEAISLEYDGVCRFPTTKSIGGGNRLFL